MINHARGYAEDRYTVVFRHAKDRRYTPRLCIACAYHHHLHAFVRQACCRLGQIGRRCDGGDFNIQAERFGESSDLTDAIDALRLRRIDYSADGLNIGRLDLGQAHILLVRNRQVCAAYMRHLYARRISDAGGIGSADDSEEQNRRVIHLLCDVCGYLGDRR